MNSKGIAPALPTRLVPDGTEIASDHPLLRVAEVRSETIESRTFVLDVPETLKNTYCGRAGQFVEIAVPGELLAARRCYSLSSTPELGEPLQFTVKRVAGGRISTHLVDDVRSGDYLQVAPPAGRFTLQKRVRRLVLVAGGSGVTPIFSLLKQAVHTTARDIVIITSNRTPDAAIFDQAIGDIVAQFPERVRWVRHFSDETGFLTPNQIVDAAYGASSDVYVCGPEPLMDLVAVALADLEASGAVELIFERFVSAGAPAETPPSAAITDHEAITVQVTVRLDGQDYAFSCRDDQFLLEAAQLADIPLPFSCREGHCGACKSQLVTGQVRQERALALSRRDRERNRVLPCIAMPVESDAIALDYDA